MVASLSNSFEAILPFKEVKIGQLFADSKTGKEYVKIDEMTGVGDGQSYDSIKGAMELFEPSCLVYGNIGRRAGWL